MAWLLALVRIIGSLLFVFSVWVTAVAALRMISGRRRTRRIWHGHFAAPRAGFGPMGTGVAVIDRERPGRHRRQRRHRRRGPSARIAQKEE